MYNYVHCRLHCHFHSRKSGAKGSHMYMYMHMHVYIVHVCTVKALTRLDVLHMLTVQFNREAGQFESLDGEVSHLWW